MTTLRLGQKVTIQHGELEVTGELTCARVYLKGGDPNGYTISQPRPEPFPHVIGDWVLVKDEELTWADSNGNPKLSDQDYRGG